MTLAAAFSSSSVTSFASPIRFTRPSAAPLNSLAATVRLHLPSCMRSVVCVDMVLKKNRGLPASSGAKPTTEPPGKPGMATLLVLITAKPWLYSTSVRTSTGAPSFGAEAWCSRSRSCTAASSGSSFTPPPLVFTWWPVGCSSFSGAAESCVCLAAARGVGGEAPPTKDRNWRAGPCSAYSRHVATRPALSTGRALGACAARAVALPKAITAAGRALTAISKSIRIKGTGTSPS
mmetsp:Transcript_106151/g.317086  ORF Transcript_106151/g.317086 Transcript_106151/m.317086 type:complete len:234 (+) Transcript_106151:519-1220(+)